MSWSIIWLIGFIPGLMNSLKGSLIVPKLTFLPQDSWCKIIWCYNTTSLLFNTSGIPVYQMNTGILVKGEGKEPEQSKYCELATRIAKSTFWIWQKLQLFSTESAREDYWIVSIFRIDKFFCRSPFFCWKVEGRNSKLYIIRIFTKTPNCFDLFQIT